MLVHPSRPSRNRRRPGSLGHSFSVALILFVIICAVVVVVAAPDGESSLEEETAAASGPVQEALHELDAAREALDSNNFGEVRGHLQQARATLMDLLPEAQENQ